VLEIWTDGTIRPEEALSQAGKIMMRHLSVISGVDEIAAFDSDLFPQPDHDGDQPQKDLYQDRLIEELDLSVRVFNSLKRTGITTIGDVLDMLERGQDAMLAIRNFGEKSLDELVDKLREKGYLPSHEEEEGAVEEE
jgi:DNA-directed RNA polymerase subunit alpha